MDMMDIISKSTDSKGKQSPQSNTEIRSVDRTGSEPSYETVQGNKGIKANGCGNSGGSDNSPLSKADKDRHSANNIGSNGASPTTPTSDASRNDAKEKERLMRHQQQRLEQLERTVHALVGRLEKVRYFLSLSFSISLSLTIYWNKDYDS
jgi:hypothetical protein